MTQRSPRSADVPVLFSRTRRRELVIYIVFGLLLLAGVIFAGDELLRHISVVETWLADLGLWGLLLFASLFVVATSLLIPESVLSLMAGALFGLIPGFAIVVISNLLAATLQCAIARYLLKDTVERALAARPPLLALQQAVMGNAFQLQALIRLTPLNPASISYMLGAAGARFGGFLVACLAFAPHMLVEVYAGYAGNHAAHVAGRTDKAM